MRKKKPRGILPSKLRASSLDDIKKYVKPLDKFQKGGEYYNLKRAKELGYTRDKSGHLHSVDHETGMWLKSKKHPTAHKEYISMMLNPDVKAVVNPEGYFGKDQLQYVPRYKNGGETDPIVGVGEAFNKVVFPRKSQPKSTSTQSLSQSSGYKRPEPKTFKDQLFDSTFKRDNSLVENIAEIVDPSGVLSWDDAYQARQSWKKSGRTLPTIEEGLDMFGAVPLAGKLASGAKVFNLAKRSSKPAKYFLAEMWNKGARHIPNTVNRGDAVQDIYQDNPEEAKRLLTPKPILPKYQLAGMVGEGGEAKAMISSGQNIEALQRALNNIYPELNLSTEGVWGPETEKAYRRFQREYSGGPALSNKTGAITSLIGDVARKQFNKFTGLETRPSPMSERDITSEQLAVLNRAAKEALASGRRYIDYPDYKKEGAIDVNEAYRGDIGNKEAIKNILSDPATQMQSTIGATDIVITPSFEGLPSDTLVVDRYDFNPGSYGIEESEDVGFKEAWEKSKSDNAYQTARNLAQYLGSDPGDPSSRQSIINIGS